MEKNRFFGWRVGKTGPLVGDDIFCRDTEFFIESKVVELAILYLMHDRDCHSLAVKRGARRRRRVFFGDTEILIGSKVVERTILYLKCGTFRQL